MVEELAQLGATEDPASSVLPACTTLATAVRALVEDGKATGVRLKGGKTLRQLGHKGICVYMYCWDRALWSAMARLCRVGAVSVACRCLFGAVSVPCLCNVCAMSVTFH